MARFRTLPVVTGAAIQRVDCIALAQGEGAAAGKLTRTSRACALAGNPPEIGIYATNQ